MAVYHIIALNLKDSLQPSRVAYFRRRILNLVHDCKDAQGKPYIVKVIGGTENSIEHINRGLDLIFIIVFKNENDQLYYSTDPVHLGLGAELVPALTDDAVFDFTEGKFAPLVAPVETQTVSAHL